MKKRRPPTTATVTLEKIIGGGQALGTLEDGRKVLVWGGLPGEQVLVEITKKKSSYAEGIAIEVITPAQERILPSDPKSYLSTSPWQIMKYETEQAHKINLINDAFALHGVTLLHSHDIYTDGRNEHYRNKVEFSWYGELDPTSGVDKLHLAFFKRGGRGKIPVNDSALLPPPMVHLARAIRDELQQLGVVARQLKTLLIRSDQAGECVWQLYLKEPLTDIAAHMAKFPLPARGGEVIYSTPKSPASVITERLSRAGDTVLSDTVLGVPFRYATEGFFQINLPVYEQALRDMKKWIPAGKPVVDLYSGVGSIGLTIGGPEVTLVEINENAVREMKQNIARLGLVATPVLASSETALKYITSDKTIIVDPPRAGLHEDVIQRLLEVKPSRILYLSCNPVTQARDTAKLLPTYRIQTHRGYNFFPRTPHIEHLVVLDLAH